MTNDIYQDIVKRISDASECAVGIVDRNGMVVASSAVEEIGELRTEILGLYSPEKTLVVKDGCTYCFEDYDNSMDYAVYIKSDDKQAECIAKMARVSIEGIRWYHDEKYDKGVFIKNVVLDNILPGDVFAKAREVRMPIDSPRVVMLVRTDNPTGSMVVFDSVYALFPNRQNDFVFNLSDKDIILVKEIGSGITHKDLEKLANAIIDVLTGEHYVNSVVGIGTVVSNISELATSFREAQVAIEVGKVFDTEHPVLSYSNLGIARLIYQLPTTLCDMFLREVFKRGSVDTLDKETLFTIQRFFENNLNVSETSRGLFVHRNTLVYRLEKIKKMTGLDLRQFDHAIVFKVALMVKKYMDVNPVKY